MNSIIATAGAWRDDLAGQYIGHMRQANRLVADLDRELTAADIMTLEAADILSSRVFLNG